MSKSKKSLSPKTLIQQIQSGLERRQKTQSETFQNLLKLYNESVSSKISFVNVVGRVVPPNNIVIWTKIKLNTPFSNCTTLSGMIIVFSFVNPLNDLYFNVVTVIGTK